MKKSHVAILILNWNNWWDTVECVLSIFKSSYKNYTILIIDNGSENESAEIMTNWLLGKPHMELTKRSIGSLPEPQERDIRIFRTGADMGEITGRAGGVNFIINSQNEGFARGMNHGYGIVKKTIASDYILSLNSDTVVAEDTIEKLTLTLDAHADIKVLSPIVYNYYQTDEIDQAGGFLRPWGTVRYNRVRSLEPLSSITFANGCALMLRRKLLDAYGFYSEMFFFGEEDVDFSIRMKKAGQSMVCHHQAVVYHKVSASANEFFANNRGKAVIHRTNRLINLRNHLPRITWTLLRYGSYCYFFLSNILLNRLGIQSSFNETRAIDDLLRSDKPLTKDSYNRARGMLHER
jgi:GT2 family glycosyltransferase